MQNILSLFDNYLNRGYFSLQKGGRPWQQSLPACLAPTRGSSESTNVPVGATGAGSWPKSWATNPKIVRPASSVLVADSMLNEFSTTRFTPSTASTVTPSGTKWDTVHSPGHITRSSRPTPGGSTAFYSYLRASIGLSLAALRAGHRPKTTPTKTEKPTPKTIDWGLIINSQAKPCWLATREIR